jgi:hypothetical protein
MLKILSVIILLVLFIFPVKGEENTSEETKKEVFIDNVQKEDYIKVRNSFQGDNPWSVKPFNGYYNVKEPDVQSNKNNISPFPGTSPMKNGYSGYYNINKTDKYNIQPTNTLPVTNPGNAIELKENDLLSGVDIKTGGIPVWIQTNKAYIEVNGLKEKSGRVFLFKQQTNKNIIAYNIELPSREDELSLLSFVAQLNNSNIYLLSQDKSSQKKIGTFTFLPSVENKKISFSYKGKEIVLNLAEEGKKIQENTNKIQQNLPVPQFKDKDTDNKNTVIEVNF